jgi:hypothetical protein
LKHVLQFNQVLCDCWSSCPRSYDPGQSDPENHDPNVVRENMKIKVLIKVV